MFRHFLITTLALLLFASCTQVLSTNYPGKSEKSLPKEWQGNYEVVFTSPFPDKKDSSKPEREFARIESDRITWTGRDASKVYSLNDSLRYSVYDHNGYISLLMPEGLYAVFKVTHIGDTLALASMSTDEEPKKADLVKYFKDVEKKSSQGDDYYQVTIIEKKLDTYFKSSIPSKDPLKLVPVR